MSRPCLITAADAEVFRCRRSTREGELRDQRLLQLQRSVEPQTRWLVRLTVALGLIGVARIAATIWLLFADRPGIAQRKRGVGRAIGTLLALRTYQAFPLIAVKKSARHRAFVLMRGRAQAGVLPHTSTASPLPPRACPAFPRLALNHGMAVPRQTEAPP